MTYKTVPAWSKGNRGRRRPARSAQAQAVDVEAVLVRAARARSIVTSQPVRDEDVDSTPEPHHHHTNPTQNWSTT